jgi:hypothetical protein
MATIPPILRHMLVCDGVDRAQTTHPRLNVLGVMHTIRAKPGQSFPLPHPGLCVYIVLTGGVGSADVQIRVVEADSGIDLFGSPVHRVTYPTDRHEVSGIVFRITECVFPRPGLYWVEFHHDGVVVRQEPITVRDA